MFSYVLICLAFMTSLGDSASSDDAQCTSLFLKNITDKVQSSIVVTLLDNAKSLIEDAKKYATIKTSASADNSECTSLLLKNITDKVQSSIVVSLLNTAKNLLKDAKTYATVKPRCAVVETICDKPMDCAELLEKNSFAKSGVYKIWPRSRTINGSIEVYCDMEDDGGAWTVLQRRGDFGNAEDYFYKDWQSYQNGFGDLSKDFWLGNDNIFVLTNQRSNIVKFTLTDWENKTTYATYDDFWIDDASRKYTLHVNGYKGTAGDSFSLHNGKSFSTKDQGNYDHDENCAVRYKGAWWYEKCHHSNLNGMYLKGAHSSPADGVNWRHFKGYHYSLKDTVIKIRPHDFQKKSRWW